MSYNRAEAVRVAKRFFDSVSPDGFVGSKLGYFGHGRKVPTLGVTSGVEIKPGMPFADFGHVPEENDCAHCVGRAHCVLKEGSASIPFHGGGLHLSSPLGRVYGQTSAGKLAQNLINLGARIIHPQFQVTRSASTRTAIREKLTAGDVLIYAVKDNVNHYEHSAILVGPDTICCHTRSRNGKDFTDVDMPFVMLLKLP
jgi:hypothetical protein